MALHPIQSNKYANCGNKRIKEADHKRADIQKGIGGGINRQKHFHMKILFSNENGGRGYPAASRSVLQEPFCVFVVTDAFSYALSWRCYSGLRSTR